jgi:hypothetical protein
LPWPADPYSGALNHSHAILGPMRRFALIPSLQLPWV